MFVNDEKDRATSIMYQPPEKFAEAGAVELALDDHEAHFAPGVDCRDQVQPVAGPGASDHGCLPFRCPSPPAMRVRAHAGFIGKVDHGVFPLGLRLDPRVLLAQPGSHPLGVLFISLDQGALTGQSQLG